MDNGNSERVAWLELAWDKLREKYLPKAPQTAAVTVGFPFKNARKAAGECWGGWKEGEGYFVSINPMCFPDPVRVLQTLLHEMLHAVLGIKEGHKRKFAKACSELGFEGPPTATYAGENMRKQLEAIAAEIGPLPAGKGEFEAPKEKKQGTRMRKYICPCGQIIRAAKDGLKINHLDCGKDFTQEDAPEDEPAGGDTGEKNNVDDD